MNPAMYKAVSGAVAQMRRLDVATQNLANLKTPSFKSQRLAFGEVLASVPTGERTGGLVAIAEQRTDFSQGEIQRTGNDFDLALDGEGFFVLGGRFGPRYTREGTFTLASDGTMMSSSGEPVLAENNEPIRISGRKVEVNAEGVIRTEEGEMGRLKIVRFTDARVLSREARGIYRAPETVKPEAAAEYRVLQGSVEQSNVNSIDAMTALITLHRQYEAYSKVMQMMDGATERMLSEGARL
ncbi:MAG TPA: flagellar basal-body rod protein FlgF [Verrucomicrobiae bacterium]|jgi:flagellar basal-body rod protein FlgF|nr:flagellar basal-body rod protein FlgF [Verrucomicrobiae bacterium]